MDCSFFQWIQSGSKCSQFVATSCVGGFIGRNISKCATCTHKNGRVGQGSCKGFDAVIWRWERRPTCYRDSNIRDNWLNKEVGEETPETFCFWAFWGFQCQEKRAGTIAELVQNSNRIDDGILLLPQNNEFVWFNLKSFGLFVNQACHSITGMVCCFYILGVMKGSLSGKTMKNRCLHPLKVFYLIHIQYPSYLDTWPILHPFYGWCLIGNTIDTILVFRKYTVISDDNDL